jgi:Na+-translocating ferredoxin:NAD+ oxidoreductase RnfE subunit
MQNRLGFVRAHRIAVGVAAAAVAAVGLGVAALPAGAAPAVALNASTSQVSQQDRVPDAIQVPRGNKQIAEMAARGVQTYQCTNGAFTFLQPDAILSDDGRAEVLHTAGPVWTSVLDGSSVTGGVVASSPVPGAIPEVLLSGVAHRGPGLLSAVTFIQRLDTTGGLAPTGPCTAGTTVSVPYTADYVFWAKG